ncbi:uncharacterized protein RJT20DRAFT_130262 [Scheffersomyces xylosifermentans]|uniref:uncharacterized protein n=1 Tax=Scheffersomyces xylosifermentans TaxID=1304137 RepID=UPI00315D3290
MASLQSPFSFSFPSPPQSGNDNNGDNDSAGQNVNGGTNNNTAMSDAVLTKLSIMKLKLSKLDHSSNLISELKQLIEESYQLIVNNSNLNSVGHKYTASFRKCTFDEEDLSNYSTPKLLNINEYQTPPTSNYQPYQTPINKIINNEHNFNETTVLPTRRTSPELIQQSDMDTYFLNSPSEVDFAENNVNFFNYDNQTIEQQLFEINFELE